jgi:hypothetical protein
MMARARRNRELEMIPMDVYVTFSISSTQPQHSDVPRFVLPQF